MNTKEIRARVDRLRDVSAEIIRILIEQNRDMLDARPKDAFIVVRILNDAYFSDDANSGPSLSMLDVIVTDIARLEKSLKTQRQSSSATTEIIEACREELSNGKIPVLIIDVAGINVIRSIVQTNSRPKMQQSERDKALKSFAQNIVKRMNEQGLVDEIIGTSRHDHVLTIVLLDDGFLSGPTDGKAKLEAKPDTFFASDPIAFRMIKDTRKKSEVILVVLDTDNMAHCFGMDYVPPPIGDA